MEEPVVKTSGLGKKYGVQYAVQNLNVEILSGQIYGLIGQNGAGKTTLIRMLTGLIAPTEGQIELFGESGERGLREARRRIGSIVETPALYPGMTARQNLEAQARLLGLVKGVTIDDALELAGIADTGNKKARDFSLGMRQRLALAQAMLASPEFLLLDEPVNGLDPKGIIENRELIKKLVKERGMTVMISSHILGELSLMASAYGIIDHGRLVKQISAEELKAECRQCIRIATAETQKAAAFLKERFHVKDMETSTANSGAGTEIRIFERFESAAEMNMALCKADIPVSSFTLERQDLEGYFVKLTGGLAA